MTNPLPNDPHARLKTLGLTLPAAPKAVASYVPGMLDNGLLYVSGQLPFVDGALLATGLVPDQVDQETATECARVCTLNGLAVANDILGSLDRIERVVRVGVFVASPAAFGAQPQIANGASNLLVEVLGEAGRHARAAVGVSALPLNAPVEIEFLFRVRKE